MYKCTTVFHCQIIQFFSDFILTLGDAYYFNNRKRFTGTIACVMIFNTTLERDAIMIELRMCQGRDLGR